MRGPRERFANEADVFVKKAEIPSLRNSDRFVAVLLMIRSIDSSIVSGFIKPSVVLLRAMVLKKNQVQRVIVLTNSVPLGARMMPLAAAAGVGADDMITGAW